MATYKLKTPKGIEDAVVGTYKKVENSVVGAYKKIEGKFEDAFLEKVEEPADRTEPDEQSLKK